MELLRQQLIAYRPWNEQEERDREELLRRLRQRRGSVHPGQYRRPSDRLRLGGQPGPASRS